jgi:hypothetical protein
MLWPSPFKTLISLLNICPTKKYATKRLNKKLKMISYIQFNFFETGKSLVDCAETDLEEADINVSMRLLYRVLVMKI